MINKLRSRQIQKKSIYRYMIQSYKDLAYGLRGLSLRAIIVTEVDGVYGGCALSSLSVGS